MRGIVNMNVPRYIKSLHNLIPAWICTAFCFAAILWLTLSPSPTPEVDLPLFPGADKLVHGIMFGGLTLTACYDYVKFRGNRERVGRGMPWVMALMSLFAGVAIEFLQRFMQLGRSFEFADIAADGIGAAVAAAAVSLYLRFSSNRTSVR